MLRRLAPRPLKIVCFLAVSLGCTMCFGPLMPSCGLLEGCADECDDTFEVTIGQTSFDPTAAGEYRLYFEVPPATQRHYVGFGKAGGTYGHGCTGDGFCDSSGQLTFEIVDALDLAGHYPEMPESIRFITTVYGLEIGNEVVNPVYILEHCAQANNPAHCDETEYVWARVFLDVDQPPGGDGDTDTDDAMEDWVGYPCYPPAEEGDEDPCPGFTGHQQASCFAWPDAPAGFCTMECQPATYPDNPIDGCGMLDLNVVCMDISAHTADTADDVEGYGICVETCVPTPEGGDPGCTADYIRCDPETWSWESQFATCLLPKCQSDSDCVTASGPTCEASADCSVAEGESCSADGYCVFEAHCDTGSGRCNWDGDTDAEIGDPCESLWDCPNNGICLLPDVDVHGKPIRAHGYCSREGCKAANVDSENGSGSTDPSIDAEFGCGMLGSCQAGFPRGGLCMRRCDPDNSIDALRCRQSVWNDAVEDTNGHYECLDTTNYGYWIPTSGETMMYLVHPYPSCSWVGADVGLKCGDGEGENNSGDCDSFYASSGGWSLGMQCRDWETGEPDTDGYCLDETTSGPTESW